MCIVKFLQILNCFLMFSSCSSLEIQDPLVLDCSKSYNKIMRDLRANWQSPIMYLKKRGYIPKSEQHDIPIKVSGVINQPLGNGKITFDNNKPSKAAAEENNQMQEKFDKLARLCSSKASNKLAAEKLSSPHNNALPIKNAKAAAKTKLVPSSVKVQIPLRIQVPSAVGLNVGPSAEVLKDAAADLHSGHKSPSPDKVSFLHSMKDKLMGLFIKKPQIDIKKDIYNFEYSGGDGDTVQKLAQDYKYNSNKNDAKEFGEENKEINRELQSLLDDLKKQRRRTNKEHSLKKSVSKRHRHSKLKTRSHDYAAP